MSDRIVMKASKTKRRRKLTRVLKLVLLFLILLLIAVYFIVSIIYNNGNFSITLDKNLYYEKNLIIYDDPDYKVYRSEIYALSPETFDNISYRWLPDDLDDYNGSHNGDNYLAYTFYVENIGDKISDYWSEVIIDDSIKNLHKAIRIRVYKNGEYVVYARADENGNPEKDTVAFESDELVMREHVADFKPGDINKYTVVLWIEGSDPDCNDNLLGGEIKAHMEFNSEFIEK